MFVFSYAIWLANDKRIACIVCLASIYCVIVVLIRKCCYKQIPLKALCCTDALATVDIINNTNACMAHIRYNGLGGLCALLDTIALVCVYILIHACIKICLCPFYFTHVHVDLLQTRLKTMPQGTYAY